MADSLIKVVTAAVALHWSAMQELWPQLKNHKVPKVRINNRLYRTAGFAHCEVHEVEFASKFFNRYKHEMLCIIVPHELIHVADFIINGEDPTDFWHGPDWRRMMLEYGLPPSATHEYYINKSDPIVRLL
jgi:predicted SprT family Zn-dependent metalloprotease